RVAQLARWVDWHDSADHSLVRALRPLLFWREQIAMGVERWRQQSGPHVAGWLRSLAEFEALSSFAALSFERPAWCFPELLPVSARSMRISRVHLGASIRVTDSVLDNRSRFYAEIVRIKQVVDVARNSGAALFLLDELLSGTNSHDRQIGAAAIVRKLVDFGAIGVITTHDLALAEIEGGSKGTAANAHFDDQIVNGEIIFDYRLRAGIVTHSNA